MRLDKIKTKIIFLYPNEHGDDFEDLKISTTPEELTIGKLVYSDKKEPCIVSNITVYLKPETSITVEAIRLQR